MAELRIKFDGTSSALLTHKLSLAELSGPLSLLLKALRSAASRVKSRDGEANKLDLQVETLDDGSLEIQLRCVEVGGEGVVWPEIALDALLDDLDQARRDSAKNTAARKYLRSLPDSYSSRCYTAVMPTKGTRQITVAGVAESERPQALARTLKKRGRVAQLGFEPGQEFVSISAGGKVSKFAANAALVDCALALRAEDVDVRVVDEPARGKRLVRIDKADAMVAPPADERTNQIVTRWGNVLAELAK